VTQQEVKLGAETPENGQIDVTGSSGPPDESGTPPGATARKIDRLVQDFSRPASQITGRLISLFGLMLVVAALVLSIIHMLGAADFVATIIAGTVLAVAGILTLTTDYIGAQRAAERTLARANADALEKRLSAYGGPTNRGQA
jgi:hypothetical protein